MSQKKGMEFFKKFSGGGEGKPSILSGMKIKTTKESKPVAQTETNLNFTSKKQEEIKPEPVSRDDIDIKKQQAPSAYKSSSEPKELGVDFKKANSKSSENKQRVQVPQKQPQIKEEDTLEETKAVEPVPAPHKNLVETKSYDQQESRSSKSYKHTAEAGSIQAAKNDHSPRSAKPETKEKKVQVLEKKKPQKPVSTKKPEEAVSTGRRPSTTREPQKPKKSDREQVLEEINEFTVKLAKTIIYQREIKMQISQAKASISDLRDQVARWASQQTICAQKEQYQEADRLQQSIQEGEKKIQQLQMQLSYMEEQVVKQQHEEVQLLKSQNSNMKRLSRKLKLVELQLQDEAADIKRTEMEKIQTLKTKQESERKKMARIQKDISYQSEQIAQFEKQFTKELDQKMNPLKEQRDDLEENKTTLEAEIKELERRLKEKKTSLAEVVKELKIVNQNITTIEESFKEESVKLQERKNKLQLVENERDQIHLTITDIDATIQQETQSMDAKFNQKMNEANELSELAKNIEQKQITFEDEIEARRAALDSFLLNANSLKEFEAKHRAQKQKIKEIEYKKSTISGEISKLQERREELKKKIPALQVEQKKFADQKNFKAAGIKKGEIKEINEELTTIKDRLDGYLGEEHALEIQYDEITEAQKEANLQEAVLQKNLAYSQVKFDSEKLRKLEEYQTDIQKANGLPPKDKQKLLRELSSEISRLKEEIKYLTAHYQLNNSPRKQPQQVQELDNNNEPELEDRENDVEELVDAQTKQVELSKEEQQHSEEEERKYEPLVLDGQAEPQELQDNEEGGYVPLQLDD